MPQQQYVKIPIEIFQKVLTELRRMEHVDVQPVDGDCYGGYPHALGHAEAQAAMLRINLEVYGKAVR